MKTFITAILASAILATTVMAQPDWMSKGEFFEEDGFTYTVEVSEWRKSKWVARREAAKVNAQKLPGTVQVRDVFFEMREDGFERATVLSFTEHNYNTDPVDSANVYVPASVRQQSKAVSEEISNELAELNAQNARLQEMISTHNSTPSPNAKKLSRAMQRELDRRIETGVEVVEPAPKEESNDKYIYAYGSTAAFLFLLML